MESMIADLRFVLRQLVRHRAFTLAAVLTLGLAVGANTAIFSVVSGVLLRPLPFPAPDRLITVCERHASIAGFCIASPPNVEDWAAASRTLEAIGIGREWSFTLGEAAETETVNGGYATPGFFRALGAQPAAGRLFAGDEVGPSAAVAVLSDALWRTRFGADRAIVGRAITLDAKSYTVIGVLPPGTLVPGLERVQLWTALPFSPRDEDNRRWRGFHVVARLAPGVSRRTAGDELAAIQRGLGERYPVTNRGWGIEVLDLRESLVGDVKGRLLVFLGAVGLVLLLGCANLANMILARTTVRSRELAIRSAVGASRSRVLRLLLLESAVLSTLGSAAGLLVAAWGTDALLRFAPPGIPRLNEVSLDWRVVTFAAGLTALTTLLFGLAPAWRGASQDLAQAVRAAGAGGVRLRGRGLLVAIETAISVTLLIGAGLLTRSFASLLGWSPGFERQGLAVGWTLLSSGTYRDVASVRAAYGRALETLRATPGISAVSLASAGPLFGGTEPGTVRSGPEDSTVARWYDVGPAYFATLGLPLVRGRDFTPADRDGAPLVAIVNASLAARLWPGEDAVGKRLTVSDFPEMEVVGVAADVPPLHPDQPAQPEVYWPFLQQTRWAAYLVVRTGGSAAAAERLIASRLADVAPDVAPTQLSSMDELLGRQLISPRFNLLLIGAFASVALALAAVGLGGLIAYGVANRTREIGIRMALGATAGAITGRFVTEGLRLIGAGALLGVAGALALTRFLRTMLAGTSPTDPLTFAGIVGLMAVAGLLAAWLPARRAGRVDPVTALRAE